MKIAFIADSFLLDKSTGVNGTQVQMYNLASAFKGCQIDIHYISLTKNLSTQTETIDGIKLHWLEYSQTLLPWVIEIRAFKEILDLIQPDVLYQRGRSHLTYLSASWAKENGKKFIWGSNGEDSCDFWKLIKRVRRSNRPLWKKLLLYPHQAIQDLLFHKGIRGATRVVNQTEHQKAMLMKNYNKQGLVLPSYFLPPADDENVKKEKVVLWLANLSYGKQPEKFIHLAEFCRDCDDWLFLLGGGTSDIKYRQTFARMVAHQSNLQMIGAIPFEKTQDYFSRASIFVNTSLPEADGLPNAMIQAWLNNTPTLSLNHDPNGWIKEHGLGYYAQGDLDQFLKEGKALLLDDERRVKMGGNCGRFAKRTFTANETIDAYLKVFKEYGRGV